MVSLVLCGPVRFLTVWAFSVSGSFSSPEPWLELISSTLLFFFLRVTICRGICLPQSYHGIAG